MRDDDHRQHYDRLTITLHWLMLGVFIALYACIELRVLFPKGSDPREALKAGHFMLGLLVLVLAGARVANRARRARPPIDPPLAMWQSMLSTIAHRLLYILMIGMPLLGWLTLSAAGKPVPFFGLELPGLIDADKTLATQLKEIHEIVGQAGYWLIGGHASAALIHHFFQRDDVLVRMLPAALRSSVLRARKPQRDVPKTMRVLAVAARRGRGDR